MSYLNRINNSLVGGISIFEKIGWLGDSITVLDYLGPTGDGPDNQKLSFASIVSSYYGAGSNNQASSGRILSSFLPAQSGPVGAAVKNFDGEWLDDSGTWYWWDPVAADWVAPAQVGAAIDRNGTNTAQLDALINDVATTHIVIAHSGINDDSANNDGAAGDNGAHGSRHYKLLLTEILKRLFEADKTVMLATGFTISDPTFHGFSDNTTLIRISRYSEASRQVAYTDKINCCSTGLRLALELSLGRVDILTRNSQVKPDNQTQPEWDAYLAGTGDAQAETNGFRVFDETEDYLHIEDADRNPFWYNIHPNVLGHYIIANELLKYINENGFT